MKNPTISDDVVSDLIQLASDLRDPNGGCPWDLKQSHQSMIEYLVEETYEVIDAIENLEEDNVKTYNELQEELGDLLFHIVLHSQLSKEKGKFDFYDVVKKVRDKLIYRHPHVYKKYEALTENELLQNWETLKRSEKQDRKNLLSGVPKSLPALLKSYRIGQKLSRFNFDWSIEFMRNITNFAQKLPDNPEVLNNSSDIYDANHKEKATQELGNFLFFICQLARRYHLEPEKALQMANQRFKKQFDKAEDSMKERLDSGDIPTASEWMKLLEKGEFSKLDKKML